MQVIPGDGVTQSRQFSGRSCTEVSFTSFNIDNAFQYSIPGNRDQFELNTDKELKDATLRMSTSISRGPRRKFIDGGGRRYPQRSIYTCTPLIPKTIQNHTEYPGVEFNRVPYGEASAERRVVQCRLSV
jgi:hypothetical protein